MLMDIVISATPWLRVRARRAVRVVCVCGFLLIVVSVAAMRADRREAPPQPGRDVIVGQLAAGKLIVAARNLPDPNFTDTVVLIVQYSRDGAAGIVLNRPSGVPLSRALPGVEQVAGASATAFIGGPVSQGALLALARASCDSCRPVGRGVYLIDTADALKARLAEGSDTRSLRIYAGYAGWGQGQLEAETRRGSWHVLDGDARVVFDPDPKSLWQRMSRRAEAVLASVAGPTRRRLGLSVGAPAASTPRATAGPRRSAAPSPRCEVA
jgi:putative transcriptional regulator